jgi:alpha-N-acetylglucosamine transferase
MRFTLFSILTSFLFVLRIDIQAQEINERNAIVTLVTGHSSGYVSGAIALGQSLIDIGSVLKRVIMVTPDVEKASRESLSHMWEIIDVQPIKCNHNNILDPSMFDLESEQYKAGIEKWSLTCTKFAAFSLVQFDRVIFMDSDMLVGMYIYIFIYIHIYIYIYIHAYIYE